ncbi:MAG: DUF1538 domain-containing protein [Leptospirales bacterium]|nr:DUF1538 domain-containing protein [Leptospirales bacterium]
MNRILKTKIMESFSSVLPITSIVLIASIFLVPMSSGTILMFLVGSALLIIGMGFFSLGADMTLIPLGEGIGIQLTRTSNIIIIIIVSFIMGFIITIAEPNLQVLAKQVPSIPSLTFTVAIGVSFFLTIAVLRIFFRISLSILLLVCYIIVFGVAFFVPNVFIPVAVDSGGVATGPLTVPLIMAIGLGIASVRSDKDSLDDSFGLVAICSIGPILSVLLLGLFYNPSLNSTIEAVSTDAETSREAAKIFAMGFPNYFRDVFFPMSAIFVFFLVFQILTRRYKIYQLVRMGIGFLYTLIGLTFFLTGANIGFVPVGRLLGLGMASSSIKLALLPLSMVIGYFIITAEPTVHVLTKQVEEVSSGAIQKKILTRGLACGMALSLAVTMLKIFLSIPVFWVLILGYSIAFVLTFFVPKIFTGIAFDSGGVCSGPMTACFLLPLAIGVCEGIGGNWVINALGIVAMVAMSPIVVIQLMGVFYARKMKAAQREQISIKEDDADSITEF